MLVNGAWTDDWYDTESTGGQTTNSTSRKPPLTIAPIGRPQRRSCVSLPVVKSVLLADSVSVIDFPLTPRNRTAV